jgi:hypothetical protein
VSTVPGTAWCTADRRTDVRPVSEEAVAAAPGTPLQGYGPSQLQSAYNLTAASAADGAGETVAIVDAYDDPNAESDLAVYRSQYGLPACTSANGCFEKVNEQGAASPLPAPAPSSPGWASEESLDLDMVSAICPNCHIVLVEVTAAFTQDLGAGVNTAVAAGAKFVSNSYAANETSSDPAYEADYRHPGVVVAAGAGDTGYGVDYPASSEWVTAVGATTLTQASNARGWSETPWYPAPGDGTGSGCSAYMLKPTWQADSGCARRTVADVAADGDPSTGAAVYDSFDGGGWGEYGGTSMATPIITATYALAGTPAAGTYPASYPYAHTAQLYDVTSGSNAPSCATTYLCTAGPGYDGPSGLGTPNGTGAFTPGIGNTITVAYPGAESSLSGNHATVPIRATDTAAGQTLTYAIYGQPPGVSINSAYGTVSGTPTVSSGTYNVTVVVTDGTGANGSTMFTWTIRANQRVTVTNPGSQGGVTGTSVSLPVSASDSASGQTLAYTATGLPPGLSMSAGGTISGTPTTTGLFRAQVVVTDQAGITGSAAFTWTIGSPGGRDGVFAIAPPAQYATVGTTVALRLQAGDSVPSQALTYSDFDYLPPGLSLNSSTGLISGTPTTAGTYSTSIEVTDGTGVSTGFDNLDWTITANSVSLTPPGSQAGRVGTGASVAVTATDSDPNQALTYSASGLPPGLSVNPGSGLITGAPQTAGTYSPTLTATDPTGASASGSVTWTVSPPAGPGTILVSNPVSGITAAGTAVSLPVSATDSQPGSQLSYTATGLPPGISIAPSTGVISGTPATAGTYQVAITASDTTGSTGSVLFTWGIAVPASSQVFPYTPGPQGGVEGAPVVLPLHFVDSDPAQTLTYTASGLPPGLSVNPVTGVVAGTPATPGIYGASVTALDTSGQSAVLAFAWTIGNPGTANSVFFWPPAPMTLQVGQNVSMRNPAGDSDPSQVLTYAAAGLPPGISINPQNGWITGTATTAGTYQSTVTATDSTGAVGQVVIPFTINP